MREAGSVLAGIVTAVADRCAVESIPWTLERLERIGRVLRTRSVSLAMLSTQQPSRPPRLMDAVRVLSDSIREPGRVEEVRPEDVAAILIVIAALEGALAARLIATEQDDAIARGREIEADRLLTAQVRIPAKMIARSDGS